MRETYGEQIVFLQVNKDTVPEIVRKYGARGFPSFFYVKPGMNGRVASRFSEERDYGSLKKWMNKLVTVHGGVVEVEDEEPDDEI